MINLENFNEAFFLLMCYHFVLYCNMLAFQSSKDFVGKSLINILAFLIISNTIIVARVCLIEAFRKLKLKKLQKK